MPAVELEQVCKTFRYRPYARGTLTLKTALLDALRMRPRPPWVTVEALRDVSFSVEPGEALGVIGSNGAGKSTLLRLVGGVYRPDSGRLHAAGRRGLLLDLGAGFHPELSGRENAEIAALVAGVSAAELKTRLPQIAEFAGLEGRLDAPVRTYSSGMRMRLGFSVAAALAPEVLIVDEVLAVGDAEFQERCLARIEELRRGGTALVVASHSLELIERVCDRALLLEGGRVALLASPAEVCRAYRPD